jgi:hypothetical protein
LVFRQQRNVRSFEVFPQHEQVILELSFGGVELNLRIALTLGGGVHDGKGAAAAVGGPLILRIDAPLPGGSHVSAIRLDVTGGCCAADGAHANAVVHDE